MTDLIDEVRELLTDELDLHRALLFGSVARGTHTAESDADLAVQVPDGFDVLGLSSRLSMAIGREVDVISLRDPGVPMIESLLRDAIPVHEGRHGAYAQWRSHMLLDREIDLPWYERMRDAWLEHVAKGGLR